MLLNLDVWHDIVGYLESPRDKSTLRSISLTSRALCGLALNVLWRNGDNFMSIVSVINSSATSPDGPFLECRPPHQSPRSVTWVSNRPLPYASRSRALEYLARIEKLTVFPSSPPSEDILLWPALSDCLGNPTSLLPNLKYLKIGAVAYDCIEYLTLLVSPGVLKTLEITAWGREEGSLVLPLLKLVQAYNCDLQTFIYDRGPTLHTLEMVMALKSLQNVQISRHNPHSRSRWRESFQVTIVKFLASLPALRSLSCNLLIFQRCVAVGTGCRHSNLRMIDVASTTVAIYEMFRCCVFPSVTEVTIVKKGSDALRLDGLKSCCPNVRNLDIHTGDDDGSWVLDFQYLAPLLSLPIEVFCLRAGRLHLTPTDLHIMSESWPRLSSFTLWPLEKIEFDKLLSLTAFSGHHHLRHLDLGIQPLDLLVCAAAAKDLMVTHVPKKYPSTNPCILYFLPYLDLDRAIPIVVETSGRVLMEFLLLLFPGLSGLMPRDRSDSQYLKLEKCRNGRALISLQRVLIEARKEKEGARV